MFIDLSKYHNKDNENKIIITNIESKELGAMIAEQKSKITTKIIELRINDKTYKIVEYKKLIDLERFNYKSRRSIVEYFLIEAFRNKEIYTTDNIKVGMSGRSASKIARVQANNQQEITLYSDNLIQIGVFDKEIPSYGNKEGQFRYYNSLIKINNEVFDVKLNIFKDQNGDRLYDINKITKIQQRSLEDYGQSLVSNTSISNGNEDVNMASKLNTRNK